jgi:O-antigen/teichoic acid export membrane protein
MNFSQILKAKLFQHTVIYTGINIFDKTIPFLIIPILTRLISKEEIGLYTLYQTLFQILIPILTLSIDNTIIINYYKQNKRISQITFQQGWFYHYLFI